MSRRAIDWDKGLSQDLRNKKFASAFIISCLEEGLSLQEALGRTIRCYGLKEFSSKAKIPCSNILRTIDPKNNPTFESLHRLLKPFGLKLGVQSLDKKTA